MAHDITGTEVLDGLEYLLLLLLIGAVYAPWFKHPYRTIPASMSVVLWRVYWFLVYGGVVAAIYSYFWATHGFDGPHASGTFAVRSAAWHDSTWIIIIVHLFHLKLLEIFTAVRYKRIEYWISTAVYVVTFLVSTYLSVILFYQKVWGAGAAYAVLALSLLGMFIYMLWRQDGESLNYMARLSGNELPAPKKQK